MQHIERIIHSLDPALIEAAMTKGQREVYDFISVTLACLSILFILFAPLGAH